MLAGNPPKCLHYRGDAILGGNGLATQILHALEIFVSCRSRIRELASTPLNLMLMSQVHTKMYDTAIFRGYEGCRPVRQRI